MWIASLSDGEALKPFGVSTERSGKKCMDQKSKEEEVRKLKNLRTLTYPSIFTELAALFGGLLLHHKQAFAAFTLLG
jgi:hypothetical protein